MYKIFKVWVFLLHLQISVNGRVSAVTLSDRSLKHPDASVLLHTLDSLTQLLVLLAHLLRFVSIRAGK